MRGITVLQYLLSRFLLLVFYYLYIVCGDSLEDARLTLDQLENVVGHVSLNDNLVLSLCILGNRCTCRELLCEELGCFFQLNVYRMRHDAFISTRKGTPEQPTKDFKAMNSRDKLALVPLDALDYDLRSLPV